MGLNPLDPADADRDSDHDGSSDREEFLAGTDPSDPDSALRVSIELGRSVRLSFQSVFGRRYQVERNDSLDARRWVLMGDVMMGNGRVLAITDATLGRKAFYRVGALSR